MIHLGFASCPADSDVWMRLNKESDVYEYIAVYVDDLCIALKNPESLCKILKEKYKYKLKGTGPIEYHLGINFQCDNEGKMTCSPRKYIEKSMTSYINHWKTNELLQNYAQTIFNEKVEATDTHIHTCMKLNTPQVLCGFVTNSRRSQVFVISVIANRNLK